MLNTEKNDMTLTITQIFFFPYYYLSYIYVVLKNLAINPKEIPTKQDYIYHLIYTFTGILTIKFVLLLLKEINLIEVNYNNIINNLYFIVFYAELFSFFLFFSVLLSLLLFFSNNFKLHFISSIFLFSIKVFNIFFPIIICLLVFILDYMLTTRTPFDFNNIINTFHLLPSKIQFICNLFSIVVFILVMTIIYKTRNLLLDNYYIKNKGVAFNIFFNKIIPIFPMLILYNAILLNLHFYTIKPNIKPKMLINKYEFCTEVINYSLYQTNEFNGKEPSFLEYQKMVKNCQKNAQDES